MSTITTRSIRRQTEAGRKNGRTFERFLQLVQHSKRSLRLDSRPSSMHGSKVMVRKTYLPHGATSWAAHHPTKKATKGRYAFVTLG